MQKNSGFTLLELLSAIAIVAILSSISVPYLHDMVINQRRHVEQKRLLATLSYARSMAISHGKFVTVCPSTDKRHCVSDWQQSLVVFTDQDTKANVDEHDTVLRRVNALAYGKLHLKAFPSTRYFRFHPNGFSDNQNGTFAYCYQQQGWQLILNRTGRMREEMVSHC